jgi:diadenosine tetraphosphate (Ap4A) HIT family hydrolase
MFLSLLMLKSSKYKMSYSKNIEDSKGEEKCEFCGFLKSGEFHKESEYFFVVDNIFPYEDYHIMLLPKRHVHSELDFTREELDDLEKIHRLILKRYYEEFGMCFSFCRENTPRQSMWHWHRHYMPTDSVLINGIKRIEYQGMRVRL